MSTEITAKTITRRARLTSGWDDTPVETVEVQVPVLIGTVASWRWLPSHGHAVVAMDDGVDFLVTDKRGLAGELDSLIGKTIRVEVAKAAKDAAWMHSWTEELTVLDAGEPEAVDATPAAVAAPPKSVRMATREWTHPTTGEVRRYIEPKDVWEAMPATDSAGFPYKNADYGRIMGAKFWLDSDGVLHIEQLTERGRIDAADVRAAIEAAL